MDLSYSEQIKIILIRQNKSVEDLARALDTSRQNLHNQFKRDNFKYNDMVKIAAALGYDVKLELIKKDGGAGTDDQK